MINKLKKNKVAIRRKERQRYKLLLTGTRPRLVFHKSNKYLSVQIIDDAKGLTLAAASSSEKNFPKVEGSLKNKKAAVELGKLIAERAKSKGVKQVMLDRSGMVYHGKIESFANSARENGLEF